MKAKQTCGYLYSDGHAVIIFEQDIKLGSKRTTAEYAVIYEKFTDAHLSFSGRICFSRYGSKAMLDLCKRATHIRSSANSVENGSDASRKLGVEVGNLSFDFPDGSYLHFTDTSILSAQYKYQPEVKEAFNPDCTQWGPNTSVEIKLAKRAEKTIASQEIAA